MSGQKSRLRRRGAKSAFQLRWQHLSEVLHTPFVCNGGRCALLQRHHKVQMTESGTRRSQSLRTTKWLSLLSSSTLSPLTKVCSYSSNRNFQVNLPRHIQNISSSLLTSTRLRLPLLVCKVTCFLSSSKTCSSSCSPNTLKTCHERMLVW